MNTPTPETRDPAALPEPLPPRAVETAIWPLLGYARQIAKLLRVARGWSREVLAELAGLHRNYVGHVERGEVNVGLENLMRCYPVVHPRTTDRESAVPEIVRPIRTHCLRKTGMQRACTWRWLMILPVTLSAAFLIAGPAHSQDYPGGNPKRGSFIASGKCAACHGADGNSANPLFPKLAGQKAAYLYGQLRAFKAGGRVSPIMSGIAATLTDTEMADAASFFARQALRPDQIKHKTLASAGRSIFHDGANRGATPACAMCHDASHSMSMMGGMSMMGMRGGGMMGGGMMAAIPGLNGQHAAYLVKQLDDFATGKRQSMMMNSIATTLTDAQKQAVAEYLSGHP
ncbi:c-type cytochrome [Ferrovum sp.]|uniref:c-type cytochrome n=1 Tax=Ferrovum sp. TaxID=2609467 RepID=UPI00262D79C1|nr:c-type cytochrome [Ferrovum sp.]